MFQGDVSVTGGAGDLDIESNNGYAFFRDGVLTKDGQAELDLEQTFVYFSNTSYVTMVGGSGELEWTAPTTGPFKGLALWSDNPTDVHRWAGQAFLDLEGVFFVPRATVHYQGNGVQQQVAAQFVADKLHVAGNGVLRLKPNAASAVPLDPPISSTLIR